MRGPAGCRAGQRDTAPLRAHVIHAAHILGLAGRRRIDADGTKVDVYGAAIVVQGRSAQENERRAGDIGREEEEQEESVQH